MTKDPTKASSHLRIATRGSMLALWQSRYVAKLLSDLGVTSELVVVKTTGDKVQDRYLHEVGGKGLFIKELEETLSAGGADIAVHSMKDLPAKLEAPFTIGAVLKRHDPRDVLILPAASQLLQGVALVQASSAKALAEKKIGSSSLRRQCLLRQACSAIELLPLRGNVDTRIGKLLAGEFDGMVLAFAAMHRLALDRRSDLHMIPFDPNWFVPCVAQGAISIETTAGNSSLNVLSKLNDPTTASHVTLEREILAKLGGDCTMPFGCHVSPGDSEQVIVSAVVLSPGGQMARTKLSFASSSLTKPTAVTEAAAAVVDSLHKNGAAKVLAEIGSRP